MLAKILVGILVGIQLAMLGIGVLMLLFGDIIINEVDRRDAAREGGGR